MEMHPLYLMIPATIMASFAFRLPVGTPPNAIVTIVGKLPTKSLIIGGCAPAVYSLIISITLYLVWSAHIFGVHEFPAWASYAHTSNSDSKCD